jgi:6,7-dimethyl-8-ribityllumazine synthase
VSEDPVKSKSDTDEIDSDAKPPTHLGTAVLRDSNHPETDSITDVSIESSQPATDSVTIVSKESSQQVSSSVTTVSKESNQPVADSIATVSKESIEPTTNSMTTVSEDSNQLATNSIATASKESNQPATNSIATVSTDSNQLATNSIATASKESNQPATNSITTVSTESNQLVTNSIATASKESNPPATNSITTASKDSDQSVQNEHSPVTPIVVQGDSGVLETDSAKEQKSPNLEEAHTVVNGSLQDSQPIASASVSEIETPLPEKSVVNDPPAASAAVDDVKSASQPASEHSHSRTDRDDNDKPVIDANPAKLMTGPEYVTDNTSINDRSDSKLCVEDESNLELTQNTSTVKSSEAKDSVCFDEEKIALPHERKFSMTGLQTTYSLAVRSMYFEN